MGLGFPCPSPWVFCWDVTAPSSLLRLLQEETEQPTVSYSFWQTPANPFGRVSPASSPQTPQGLSSYFPNTSTHSAAEPNPPSLGHQSEVVRTTQPATQGTGVTPHLQFHDLMLHFPGRHCLFEQSCSLFPLSSSLSHAQPRGSPCLPIILSLCLAQTCFLTDALGNVQKKPEALWIPPCTAPPLPSRYCCICTARSRGERARAAGGQPVSEPPAEMPKLSSPEHQSCLGSLRVLNKIG